MDTKINRFIALAILFTVAGLTHARAAQPAANDIQPPDLPPRLCESIQVPEGNIAVSHVYALGVQVYRWDGTAWVFVEPAANLFADDNYRGQVGTHYAGPTWESNGGSKVVARRLAGCSPSTSAIPWLLLEATSFEGLGVFNKVTYVQRVNTRGGLAPASPGSVRGEEVRVPYAAEYYFYRAS